MKKTLLSLVAVAALAAPSLARADMTTTTTNSTTTSTHAVRQSRFLGFSGPYLELNAGLSAPQDLDGSVTTGGTSLGTSLDLDNDILYSGAVGVRVTPQFRAEAEVTFRSNDVGSVSGGGAGPIGGDADVWNYMANAYYDFDLGQRTRIIPYLMAGIGAATLDASDNDTAFAYQVGAGLSIPIAERVAFTAGYRWLDTSDFDVSNGTSSFEGDYKEHQVRAGLRFEF